MAAALSQKVSDRSATVPGLGRLSVEPSGSRSVVTRVYASSPLKFLTPSNHGHAAWVYTSTYGGGLVNGDIVSIEVDVKDAAMAFLSTQSSTKVYPSPAGASSRLRASVGSDAVLVAVPDPTVCFAEARYRQVQEIDLDRLGSLVLVDWMTCGRRASGERWEFDAYDTRLVVTVDGRIVMYDGLRLAADDGALGDRLGELNVLATVVLIGPKLTADSRRTMAHIQASPIVRGADPFVTVAAVGDVGCVVRIAGRSVEDVGRRIADMLSFVPAMLGDDPWRRKW